MGLGVAPFAERPVTAGISYVGAATASGADGTVTYALSLTGITGLAQNDVVFVFQFLPRAAGGATPSGWTQIATVTGSGHKAFAYRKVMGVTPDTSLTMTGTGNAGDASAAIAIALRGVNTTTPEDATATTAAASNLTNPDCPSITTVTNGAWVMAFAGSKQSDASVVTPSGYSNTTSVLGTGTLRNAQLYAATKLVSTAGAEDPAAWGTWGAGDNATATVAARPA